MNQHLEIRRALRGDIAPVASLVENATQGRVQPDETEVMEWLFSRGLWVAYQEVLSCPRAITAPLVFRPPFG